MTRTFWIMLAIMSLAVVAFASMTSFGVARAPRAGRAVPPPAPTIAAGDDALRVPVAGVPRSQLYDSWGDARGDGSRAHHGIDIMAPAHTPVVAAAPGTVEKLFDSAKGGVTVYVRSADRRWTQYYAHLAGYARGLREGTRVRAGDVLGYVGDTGDAGAGNYHLHFSLTRTQPNERWWQGRDVNPYPLLAAGRLPR